MLNFRIDSFFFSNQSRMLSNLVYLLLYACLYFHKSSGLFPRIKFLFNFDSVIITYFILGVNIS